MHIYDLQIVNRDESTAQATQEILVKINRRKEINDNVTNVAKLLHMPSISRRPPVFHPTTKQTI